MVIARNMLICDNSFHIAGDEYDIVINNQAKNMKVITIVGARPQFVKAAMVSRALQSQSNVAELLIHTGQHYDEEMSNLFFKELDIRQPDYNLEVGSASHAMQTARIMESLEPVLLKETPDWVVVYGDTNSTLAGTLVASQLNISVAHVEAGLRSFNRAMPEEKNRVVADHLADLLFAPTKEAVSNLQREGIAGDKVQQVGDVMYDAALYYSARSGQAGPLLRELNVQKKQYLLATVHRAENTNDSARLHAIFNALMEIAETTPVVIPLHPRTRKRLQEEGLLDGVMSRLHITLPMGFLDMITLIKNASTVATDSGGLQKEAYFFGVPCITLRDETEWVELVELGVNKLAGSDPRSIVESFNAMKGKTSIVEGVYGDGHAAEKIVDCLLKHGY